MKGEYMKSIKNLIIAGILSSSISMFINNTIAQDNTETTIKKAMKDELNRNLKNLAIENLQHPYFISYTISDAKTLFVSSTLGSIITSKETPYREHDIRVQVGDYKLNNENFMDMNSMFGSGGSSRIPLDDDYYGIRRALWLATDNVYKSAAENYESKISAIKQQNLSAEYDSLQDFSKAPTIKLNLPNTTFNFDKTKWENIAKDLSGIFNEYKDVFSSNVSVYLYKAEVYFLNSEETEVKYPVTLVGIRVNAYTQAEDGEPLFDHVLYYGLSPDDLPAIEDMKKEVKAMADKLVALKNAPAFDDTYSGPILFEGQAVGELFAQGFFSTNSGLIANRKPIYSDPQMLMYMSQMQGTSLEDKIDKKVIADDITIKTVPKMKKFNGKTLIGTYEVDADGVVPDEELVVIEKGILKTLLNGRTPTPKIKKSNGHQRTAISGGGISSDIGPGVISVSTSNGVSYDELKKKLIEQAKEEGLKYAIVVKKLKTPNSGMNEELDEASIMSSFGKSKKGAVSKPIEIYRISLVDGKEELLRSAELGGIPVSSYKKILGVSSQQMAYNTVLTPNAGGLGGMFIYYSSDSDSWTLNGIPASFIVPDAILFEELDVQKEERAITQKLPVVQNPVGK